MCKKAKRPTGRQALMLVSLVIVIGLFLTGCQPVATGGATRAAAPSPSVQSSPTPGKALAATVPAEIKATKRWKIVYIPKVDVKPETGLLVDPVWQFYWEGIRQTGQELGVETSMLPNKCDTCVEDQIRLVADVVKKGGVDGIIIGVVDSVRLAPVAEKAVEAGIAVVALDTPLNSDKILTYVGVNNSVAAQAVGEWVVKQLGGRPGKVLILTGPPDHQNSMDRRDGFLKALKQANIDILAVEPANWETPIAKNITAKWLQQFSKVDAIMAANDRMALGASEAVLEARREGILITGYDALDVALQAVKEGKLHVTVDQNFRGQSRLAVQVMIRYLEKKEPLPPIMYVPDVPLITKENVDNFLSK